MSKCQVCQSLDVIKFGFNYFNNSKVQKYKCLSCKRIFSDSAKLPRHHLTADMVSTCLDLYYQGLSYRGIRNHLRQNYGIKINHNTIYSWLQEYVPLIKKFVDKFQPKLSAVWQMDETFITFKGIRPNLKLALNNGYYCWDCIDTTTRFMLDMYLGYDKTLGEGMQFFERIKNTIADEPEVIATDGNITYETCIKKYYPNTAHLQLKQISVEPNTSFIERFHGSIKARTKVMRCFDEFAPCQTTLTGYQIYYNFLRPHMALDDKTPAQVAGIDLDLRQRWASLIRNALVVVNN